MLALGFDIETTPIHDEFKDDRAFPDKVHCIVVRDFSDGVPNDRPAECYHDDPRISPRHGSIEDGVERLRQADVLVAYNGTGFDIPMLELRHRFEIRYGVQLYDCHAVTRLVHLETIFRRSARFRAMAGRGLKGEAREKAMEEAFPGRLLTPQGQFSLEAWGYRLKFRKGTFGKKVENFDTFTQEMLDYCVGDVNLLERVYDFLRSEGAERGWPVVPDATCYVESFVDYLNKKQQRNGVGFDEAAAQALIAPIGAEHEKVLAKLRERFPARWKPDGKVRTPKRSAVGKKHPMGHPKYVNVAEGAAYQRIKLVEFNPASPAQRIEILRREGWVPDPENYTDAGTPKTDEEIISDLPYDFIPDLLRYLLLNKRLGQISTGEKAWLKLVQNGKLHGTVHTCGTRTSRMAHSSPNVSQTPKNDSPFGPECRACFRPTRWQLGWVQVGVDAQKLELCCLAHRLARYDKGAFAIELWNGDPHETWRRVTLLFIRNNQKTLTYAILYGAGDGKAGRIVLIDWREASAAGLTDKPVPSLAHAPELGRVVREKLFAGVPALADLIDAVHEAFERGYIVGLDKRVIPCETEHGALNDLLQSDGAILMKHALVICYLALEREHGYRWGKDYAIMVNSHDEWQFECRPEIAEHIGQIASGAIKLAGESLGYRCPLAGEYKIGKNWSETH